MEIKDSDKFSPSHNIFMTSEALALDSFFPPLIIPSIAQKMRQEESSNDEMFGKYMQSRKLDFSLA